MAEKKRSSFLNILTILSFVGIAIFLAGGVFAYVTGVQAHNEIFSSVENYDKARTAEALLYKDDVERAVMLEAFEKKRYLKAAGLIAIFGQIFCLIGVLKMRKLNKEGFALYCVGELGVPIGTAMCMGLLAALPSLLIGLVFVVLYGTRLEEMHLFKSKLA